MIILCSCTVMVEQTAPVPPEQECLYVNVGVNLESGTKSVIGQDAEDFQSAILYAMNPDTGQILQYGSNAGSLNGTPLYFYTETKSFSWPLPTSTAMRIYCMINPPQSFISDTNPEGLTETVLKSKLFVCNGPTGLMGITGGLPKTGIMDVDKWQITTDDASLSIPVKNLFAKYRFSLDLSDLGTGRKISVNKLSVSRGNTSLPYFEDGYKQDDEALLKDFDYATAAQLQTLSKGGQVNTVDLYVLENCHGSHSGAGSWWTVYKDLCQSWPEINKCTSILLSYSITDADGSINSYSSQIFLGSGNMVDDFDVRRNMYKNITVKANGRTGQLDPYFSFSQDTYFIAPGTQATINYGSNVYQITQASTSPVVWITDANGDLATDLTILESNPASGTALIRASAGCTEGTQYWLNGGVRNSFYWPPYNSDAQAFTERRKIVMIRSKTLTFDAPAGDIYPYMYAYYTSQERFTLSAAQEIASTVRLTSIDGSIDPSYSDVSVIQDQGEYAVRVTLVPSRPGAISFTATYGENADATSGPSLTVQEPALMAFGNNHVDVYGNRTTMGWKLMDKDCLNQLPDPLRSGNMKVSKRDPYGTELKVSVSGTSGSNAYFTSSVYLAGFGGLPGFEPDNYTFNGISIPLEGTFTYPGGYSVSSTINAVLDNPLQGYSYDGKTYNYSVLQGKTAQPSYISVTNSSYKVENMMTWPDRQFTVDISRGGTRAYNGLEVWTEYSGVPSAEPFALSGGRVSFAEDLTQWGPVFYGRRVTNSESGQTVKFVHSVIRLYCHYNVFATFDVQEKNRVKVDWDNQGDIDWSPTMILHYHFGSLKASLVSNLALSPHYNSIASLLKTDITSSTRVQPILNGFTLYSGKLSGHGTYSTGLHNNYQLYWTTHYNNNRSYMVGYYDRPGDIGYDINYDWVYIDGSDDSSDLIYWRLIATSNKPWFRVIQGGSYYAGKYVTSVRKNSAGDYCFNVLDSPNSQALYLDHEGMGYLRLCPWWEGKDGKVMIGSRDLHPLTSYNASLCIVNGWYDPRPYANGLPVLKEKVGMYFFPESSSSNTRSGYPAYYSTDWPYIDCPSFGYMEISLFSHLSFGDLYSRDLSAPR